MREIRDGGRRNKRRRKGAMIKRGRADEKVKEDETLDVGERETANRWMKKGDGREKERRKKGDGREKEGRRVKYGGKKGDGRGSEKGNGRDKEGRKKEERREMEIGGGR